jgi:hypothetical protein
MEIGERPVCSKPVLLATRCKHQKLLRLVCNGLLNGAIAEGLRLRPSTYPTHGKARRPEHEFSPIHKQVPERFVQRGQRRDEVLQFAMCALNEERHDFRLLCRFLVSEDLMREDIHH